jgi:transcriptional regulator with GAF, ATPase, and Fis domain
MPPAISSNGDIAWWDQLGAGVVIVDAPALTVISANSAAGALLRLDAPPLPGARLATLLPEAASWLAQTAARPEAQRTVARGVRVRGGPGDSSPAWVDLEARGLDGGRVAVTIVDASSRVAAEGELARLSAMLSESERLRAKLSSLQRELAQSPTGDGETMVGTSLALRRVREQIERVAPTNSTVLISGETGTGKELVARTIHASSSRAGQGFVAVNCAALPESLIESELFGHERGAFTGADRRRLGKFELADGGTLFFDEIAELPMSAQAKLLRVLQDGCLERVGGAETLKVDARVVAASHRDLARQVERGRFREDLFYRLNVFRIEVPPLRERREDLRQLAEHLYARVAARLARPVLPLSEGSLRRIMAYNWPGNVRELANAIERATLLGDGPELEIQIPDSPLVETKYGPNGTAGSLGVAGGSAGRGSSTTTRDVLLDLTLEQLQRLHITHALESCGYHVFGESGAATRLDINPFTLLSRMDKFGIPRPRMMRAGKRRESGPAA